MNTQKNTFKAIKEQRFINWAAVARKHGISKSLIYHTLDGRRRSRRVRRIISDALGVPVTQLWPETRKSRVA